MSDLYRVLHIDDNRPFLRLFAINFGKDFEIISVEDPTTVMDIIRSTPIDLVIIDYVMQEITGLELLRQVRGEFPDLPVILFTGMGSEMIAQEAFNLGVSDYFIKEINAITYKERTINTMKSIIEKSKMIKALKETKNRFLGIMNSINEAIIALDHENRITGMNRAAEKLVKVKTENAIGKNLDEVLTLLDDITFEKRNDYLTPGVFACPPSGSYGGTLLKAQDGSITPVLFDRCPLDDGEGHVIGSVFVFKDFCSYPREPEREKLCGQR